MSVAISIENLTFTYRQGENPALKAIQGQVQDGTFVVVMGHGGAGKSTLCYALNGLVPRFFPGKYQGCVLLKGTEVSRHKAAELSHLVGLVLQDFEAQLFSTNVELEVAFGPENHCLPRHEIERRIQSYLNFVGLEKLRHREPASLSGGQKQRLAIASVLALEPEILMMDEPTTDLDPKGRYEVLSVADRLREEGRTLLMVDHEPETAAQADQVWLMREGQVIAQGPPAQILRDIPSLESCGIKALPILKLFHAMNWPGQPLTLSSAIDLIQKHDLSKCRKLESIKVPLRNRTGSPILKAEELVFTYPTYDVQALQGINLSIHPGEFIALLGQNGSGKTTLAKHFNVLA